MSTKLNIQNLIRNESLDSLKIRMDTSKQLCQLYINSNEHMKAMIELENQQKIQQAIDIKKSSQMSNMSNMFNNAFLLDCATGQMSPIQANQLPQFYNPQQYLNDYSSRPKSKPKSKSKSKSKPKSKSKSNKTYYSGNGRPRNSDYTAYGNLRYK